MATAQLTESDRQDNSDFNIWEYAKQKMEFDNKTQELNRTFVILGDKGVGKTAVLENIGAKSSTSKTMTLGLQYSYAQQIYFKKNITSKFYEVNGGVTSSAQIRFPFDKKSISSSQMILVVDMSDGENLFHQLSKWLPAIEEEMKIIYETFATQQCSGIIDNMINKQKDKVGTHADSQEFKYMGVPIVVLAHKFDKYEELQPTDKRKIALMLRAYCHLFGATLQCSSSNHHHPQAAKKVRDIIQNYIYDEDFMNMKLRTKDYYIRPFFIKHGFDFIKDLEISMKSHNPLDIILRDKYAEEYGVEESKKANPESKKPKFDQYPEEEIDVLREKKNMELQKMINFKKSINRQQTQVNAIEKENIRQSLISNPDHMQNDEDYTRRLTIDMPGQKFENDGNDLKQQDVQSENVSLEGSPLKSPVNQSHEKEDANVQDQEVDDPEDGYEEL